MTEPFDREQPPRRADEGERADWIDHELRTLVQPDPLQMRRHLTALHEPWLNKNRYLQVCADAKRHATFPVSTTGFDEAVAWARQENEASANVYVRPGSFVAATGAAGALKDSDVIALAAFWIDCDTDGASARALHALKRANVAPNFSVTTGSTPHLRQHHYLLVSQPIENLNKWREIEGRLISLTGSDPSVANSSRMMRLAGGVAWPRKPDRVAELVEIEFHE